MRTWIGLLLVGLLLVGCARKKEGIVTDERGEKIALGAITQEQLLKEFPPFKKSYSAYSPDSAAVDSLRNWEQDVKVLIILGTWCPDSRREVGRFLRFLDEAKNPHIQVELIGVDRSKRDARGIAAKCKIERVPTFIVLYGEREVGRIVERPRETLERDFLKILKKISQLRAA